MDDRTFRRDFFRHLTAFPLEPDDPRYVRVYDDARIAADDPVAEAEGTIEWSVDASVQLFSGFRGTGKSTELRRLRASLREAGYLVLLFDAEDYLNLSIAVDVPDFLLAVAGALGEAVVSEGYLTDDPATISYWDRFREFVGGIKLEELSAELAAGPAKVAVKANLRSDPGFTRTLQQRMAGHLGSFVADVRAYVHDIVQQLRAARPDARGIVVMVDSIEHIRGISANAEEVQESVESLFAVHASKLHLPGLHVIYTVPPWLTVLYPGLSSLYEPGGVQVLPSLKVCHRDNGAPFEPGVEILSGVVAARAKAAQGDWTRLLSEDQLRRICLQSGGHLRDLLAIIGRVLLKARGALPTSDDVVERALADRRSEFLPIANDDALWLAQIAARHDVELPGVVRLPALARFLDTHLVLCYRNGDKWYDLHPLIRDAVLAQVARLAQQE